MKTHKVFFLLRDGKEIYKGNSYNDCLIWLQNIQGNSWNYAFKYGGYSIKETEEQLYSPVNIFELGFGSKA